MKNAILVAAMFCAACASTSRTDTRLEDREVAMVLRVANLSEVREGNVARTKAANTAVRDFAAMMVNDHTNAETKAEVELSKRDLAFMDSDLSRRLDAESGASAESLVRLSGADFDRAYMDRQIAAHQTVLDTIDKTLAPQARNRHLRDQITEMRKTVQQHLEKARSIRSALK